MSSAVSSQNMQQELGNLVHPVLNYGLNLQARLDRGESPSLELEQAKLKALLLSDLEAARWIEFGGEADGPDITISEAPGRSAAVENEPFMGARYALTCWLDEMFILNSPWSTAWNERKLELAMYRSNDRAWRFWQQARLAEKRPTADALEVFYLCVMLGFRGELIEDNEKLRVWCKGAQSRLTQIGQDWNQPSELQPPIDVPPLRGHNIFRRTLMWTCLLLLFLVPLAAFILVQRFSE